MDSGGSSGGALVAMLIPLMMLAVVLVVIVSIWKVFTKAGQPGWAAIIPFYNIYVMLQIAGKPGWWLILFFIPLVNLIIQFLVFLGIAERFGKGTGFALGLMFLGIIFFPILAFGDATYQGEAQASS